MHVARTFRMTAGVLTALLAVGAVGTTAAQAKPVKPGNVTGLTASATEPAIGTYALGVDWNAATHATSYQAWVKRDGVTLKSATVTSTSWHPSVSAKPGQQLVVTVRGVTGHFKGKVTSKTLTLTDQIAPTGTFSAGSDNPNPGDATITQDSLNDDSDVAEVTRTVNWDDGSSEPWTTGSTIVHHYVVGATEVRFAATVTLKDAAGNTTTVPVVPAPIFHDVTAPTGTFAVSPASAWAKLTKVRVSQKALSDGTTGTPAQYITRAVDWRDGTTSPWTSGTTLSHVYKTAGTFKLRVTITDEAGNARTVSTSAVVVKVDKAGPKVTLTLPKAKHSVKAWRTLRGKATDAGTGVKAVLLKAVEKRKGHWFGYNATTHTWVKAATKAKAFKRSKAFSRTTDARHRWTAKLAHLRTGTLVYQVWAVDKVNNRSVTVKHTSSLTKR